MHRDVVTHVAVSAADFFITGSADGKSFMDFLAFQFLVAICLNPYWKCFVNSLCYDIYKIEDNIIHI